MISKLTREWLQQTISDIKTARNGGTVSWDGERENCLQAFELALAAMDSEPVEPIWRAIKYPVSRPVPSAKLIVWDETGKFVGYGSAVDTRDSGVAIQMSDGRRLDSNHDLRWQYALRPAPVVPDEVMPGGLAYSTALPKFESNDRDKVVGYCCFISGKTRSVESQEQAYADAKAVVSACRAAMLNGGYK